MKEAILMKPVENLLQPFYGYLELGMHQDADEELESLPPEFRTNPAVLGARLELLVELRRWKEGVAFGKCLLRLWPDELEFYFKTAYCLHELKRTDEAKAILLSAPKAIRETALYFYNLACYETRLGNLEAAKLLLEKCFKKDRRYRHESLRDPDLELLWEALKVA